MKYDFIAIGGATRDISFFTDQGVLVDNKRDILRQKLIGFEYGAKIKVDKFHYSFGGGAANAAVCLANFGLKTAALTSIGGDESGREILKNLKSHGIDTGLVQVAKDADSGSSFILVAPSGERIIFGARGANTELALDGRRLKALKDAKGIYLASLSGDWEKALEKIFSVADANGPKIYWNPGAKQYAKGLKRLAPYLRKTEVFALNKDEAIELVMSSKEYSDKAPAFFKRTDNLLRAIKGFGPQIVVITLGGEGVAAFDGRKIYRRPILREKKRVDTTGIGDVFNSSFAAGLALFDDIDKALRLALSNTASKIGYLGAQNGLLGREAIKKIK